MLKKLVLILIAISFLLISAIAFAVQPVTAFGGQKCR